MTFSQSIKYYKILFKNYKLIKKLENIYNIKFYKWQIMYIFGNDDSFMLPPTQRCSGKTFAHMLRICLDKEGRVIDTTKYKVLHLADHHLNGHAPRWNYTRWYVKELRNMYQILLSNEIEVRKIIF